MNGAANTILSKTATKREAARITSEVAARQAQLTALRKQADGGGGYGVVDGKPTLCQRLVDEMFELSNQRRKLLGEVL